MASTTERNERVQEVAPQAAPRAGVSGGIVLAVLGAVVFLTALDQTVVVTALEPIANSFKITPANHLAQLAWVVSGYLLGYVIVMPLMGRVSDLYGRRRILLGCLAIFALGSLLCAESIAISQVWQFSFFTDVIGNNSALSWLIIARFIQAVGGGAVVPVAIAAIGDIYGDRRRVLALGIIGGVTEAGGALGPLYGALIMQRWSFHLSGLDTDWSAPVLTFEQNWQWIFLLNLPIVAILVVALFVFWPRNAGSMQRGRIDWLGAIFLGGALLCASLGLGQQAGAIGTLKDAQVAQNNPILIGASVALFLVFLFIEARGRDPIIPLDLFKRGAFSSSALFSFLLGMALIIALVDIPIYVLTVTTADNYIGAGLALLRLTVMIPIGAFLGGWFVARLGCRTVGIAGALATAIGFAIMHTWLPQIDWTRLTIGTLVAGLGFGLIVAPISTTALNTTNRDRFGTASSVVTALRMIGMILGLAALSAWGVGQYTARVNALKPSPEIAKNITKLALWQADQQTIVAVQIVTDFFLIAAVIAALAIIPAAFLWRPKPGEGDHAEDVAVFSMGL